MDDRTYSYTIDRRDFITSVNESWLAFAQENRATDLTEDLVVGRKLWSFIEGRETRLLYEDLFHEVRASAASFELPFRCDSPDRFRFMRLQVTGGAGESIECKGSVIREQERPFYSILDRAFPRSKSQLPMCSLCKRIYAFESRWLDLEDAIAQLDLFDSSSLPELQYTVCAACAAAKDSRLGGSPGT